MTQNTFVNMTRGALEYAAAPHLAAPHAFTTRLGGVDTGFRQGLNIAYSSGGDLAAVEENHRILCGAIGLDPARLVWGRQVHGRSVLPAREEDICRLGVPAREGDGIVTGVPGLGLVVYTADCVPILLSDPLRGVVAAVHAGWRGTVLGIAKEGVRAMTEGYGCRREDIRAAIGPAISQCCFQVGQEVAEAVMNILGPEGEAYISRVPAPPRKGEGCVPPHEIPGKFYVDNKGVNRALLIKAGLDPANIAVSDECTRCDTDRFWSHRYCGSARGSQGAIIAPAMR